MSCDVDIDFADRTLAMNAVFAAPAMIERDGKKTAHPSGVYFQNVPIDPFTKLCALDYKEAEAKGYFKIDFLNQSVYQQVESNDHLDELLAHEPEWSLLEEESFVDMLPHIRGHFAIVDSIKPKSIEDLAVVLALIRPGMRHLVGQPRSVIDAKVWDRNSVEGYTFRKAHAVSYGALVVVRMNLLTRELLADLEKPVAEEGGWNILDPMGPDEEG